MLVTPACVICRRPGQVVCQPCSRGLEAAPSLAAPLWVDECFALLDYRAASSLLTALKNHQRRDLVPWLADRMAPRWTPPVEAVVTWAPTGASRRRARGYDQAELLARALARRWGLPAVPLLRRLPGPAQAGRSAHDRRVNPGFRPRARPPGSVVLVDDIATTGATLTAAARALRLGGAQRVLAAVAARAAFDAGVAERATARDTAWVGAYGAGARHETRRFLLDITVSARHLDISTALRAAAEEKIGRLSRFGDGRLRADVHFREERNPRISAKEVCEVSIEGPGRRLHCKASAADPFAAIDVAVGKLEQQLHKVKTKQGLWGRQGPRRQAGPVDRAEVPTGTAD